MDTQLPIEEETLDLTLEGPAEAPVSRVRETLLRRLVDVVALPVSVTGVQDRAIAGDLLLELLIDAEEHQRVLCAKRLANMSEAPTRVLRYLAQDIPTVSDPILEESKALDQSDLVHTVRQGASYHRLAIAGRQDVGACVSDAIVESGDIPAMARMLQNKHAELSDYAVDKLVSESRDARTLTRLMLARTELRPAHALVMFWWCDEATRKDILMRFSAERLSLIESCSDVFAMAAKEDWADPVVRKGLQVIERRQRNRAAQERSEYENLEVLITDALKNGMTRDRAEEISYLAGIKPLTGAKIFADKSGEGIAVLAKAVGLKRQYFTALWAAFKRPISKPNAPDAEYERVLEVYDMLAVAKAQTVLRYWNWSLSSAFSPEIVQAAEGEDENELVRHGERSARLIFGR